MATSTPILLSPAKLQPLIKEERTKCQSLGIQLDIPLSRLQQLERKSKNRKPVTDCFEEMCQKWLKGGDRKWTEVYEALEQQGYKRLKNSLEEEYKNTPVKLKYKDFIRVLKEMIPKWYTFGTALGISTTDLNVIKDEEGGLEFYMISMLEEWKETCEDEYTWENLQTALITIGNRRLAKELEKHKVPSKNYGCKVFYQRRGANVWKTRFDVFPSDKSDRVKGDEGEQEGPSCNFDLEKDLDKLKIVPKGQPGWYLMATPRKEVSKASVDKYTGQNKPPSCEITVAAASSESNPPDLAMEVELVGPKPAKIMKLEQQAENVSTQAPSTTSSSTGTRA